MRKPMLSHVENDTSSSLSGDLRNLRLATLAVFVALSVVIYVLETLFLPTFPVPGFKLGLANLITLVLLAFYSWRECLFVTIARVVVGSFITGAFFTPAFVFSLVAGVLSTAVMIATYELFYGKFSFVGISVLGAITHNIVQLLLAAFLLAHPLIFVQTPLLLLAALITGVFNGVLSNYLCKKLVFISSWFRLSQKKALL